MNNSISCIIEICFLFKLFEFDTWIIFSIERVGEVFYILYDKEKFDIFIVYSLGKFTHIIKLKTWQPSSYSSMVLAQFCNIDS